VDYEYETGKIRFNAAQAGNTIRFDYKGTGHVIAGTFINILSDWIGKNYTVEDDHDHDGVNSKIASNSDTVDNIHAAATATANKLLALNASAEFPANVVTAASLKTAAGIVSNDVASWTLYALPGGAYGFYPQLRQSATNACSAQLAEAVTGLGASYVTVISLLGNASGPTTIYAQQTYVTASGRDYFIFLVYDNILNRIISSYSAPDHPCYGNGDDEELVPHPFADYWKTSLPSNLDIILIEKADAKEIQKKVTRNKSAIEVIEEGYDLDVEIEFKKDLDISTYEGHHRNLQNLHKDIKYRKLKTK